MEIEIVSEVQEPSKESQPEEPSKEVVPEEPSKEVSTEENSSEISTEEYSTSISTEEATTETVTEVTTESSTGNERLDGLENMVNGLLDNSSTGITVPVTNTEYEQFMVESMVGINDKLNEINTVNTVSLCGTGLIVGIVLTLLFVRYLK